MTKEQFFYKCFGLKIKYGDYISDKYELFDSAVLFDANESNLPPAISDCQIIGRRISQMTEDDYINYSQLQRDEAIAVAGSTGLRGVRFDTFESIEFLFDNGYFPDKYFDELKWVVEK